MGTTTYGYNVANEITTINGIAPYSFDSNGNMTASGTMTFVYNAENRLSVYFSQETNVTTGKGELLRDANPFRYCGYQYDPEMGLYYLKAMYYTPGLGRFLTNDPFISRNRYIYAANNPTNYIDINGAWAAVDMTIMKGN